jgi:hypothetical protein
MTTDVLIDTSDPTIQSTHALSVEILKQINEQDVLTLDALIAVMPQYSWNRIFDGVDRLARCGKIVLRRHRFEYTLFSTNFVA